MKAKEILDKTVAELLEVRRSLEKKRLNVRFGAALKGDKMRPAQYGEIRKDIARINTILREKQLKGEVQHEQG